MVQLAFRRGIALGIAVCALAGGSAHAQDPAHGASAAAHAMHSSGWAELDDFHMLMMATWHPAKQKNDLAPIRAEAADMAAAADRWKKSAAPGECANPETEKIVAKIAEDSQALAALVERNGTDEEVKAALAALHDEFEHIEHGCAGGH